MQTIAVFSDVHGNLPALEAVLGDLDRRRRQDGIDAVYCLGDLVGYGTWPNEVCDAIRARGIPTIAGNYDEGVGLNSDDCGCAYKTEDEQARGEKSIAYTNYTVSSDSRRFLRGLPRHIRLSFEAPRSKSVPVSVLLVHGSPRRINEYLTVDRPEKSMIRMMSDAGADVMLFGHTHKPYHRVFEVRRDDEVRYLHCVNTGSVGKPKDGDPRAGYVLLTIDPEVPTSDPSYLSHELVRVSYDVETAAAAVESSVLPNEYADMLRRAY